ncbi:PREDICTED: uncharacterized protein LOC108759061 [Trachymyrmex cornetzi]|uniref:Nucleolus and neural progenitor protein-like N-terminal domain-containing protein n=1 Tax=Trachymyrmex cornetzi TaxID=471704 RepID=A0A151JBM3_9HYME|nr:PREDICTED: uncharacterized protein LOC108759061 [Trachymyrmex cornetzi]KYN22517.1 hypothetical protein ALC57_05042 [Trachymyrmex cornetzi]
MMAFWNQVTLERPPYTIWQVKPPDAKRTGVDVSRFKKTLSAVIHDFESMDDLHRNVAVLNRLIYRMKNKFRNDKGFMSMVRLGKALDNCYRMCLKNDYVTLKSLIQMRDRMYSLPSRQNLEYVLARTQGFGKLMTRIESISWIASHYFISRIKLGHAWNVALVALATVCRIWFHTRDILSKCCFWYDELYRFTPQFQYVGAKPWLPNDQSLPHNLKSWLCVDWEDRDLSHNSSIGQQLIKKIMSEEYDNITNEKINTLMLNEEIDDSEIDDSDTDNSRLTQNIEVTSNNNVKNKFLSNNDTEDIGEVINRETFVSNSSSSLPPNDGSTAIKRKHVNTNQGKSSKKSKMRRKQK